MLAIIVAVTPMTFPAPRAAHAQEADASDVEETEISLEGSSEITVDTEGSRVRIYGEEVMAYQVPVNITASCTVILDHIYNPADLTVADGIDVEILLRGPNVLNDIRAQGGSATHVCIYGTSADDKLTANFIACPDGGSTAAGAEVLIENCTVVCNNLACGGNGKDMSRFDGSATFPNATPGSNASPLVTVRSADLTVSGNLACGGNGQSSIGTWSSTASAAGSSGEVLIDSSRVTVTGNVSMGGTGGSGYIRYSDDAANRRAGHTSSSSPVTIRNHSTVNVSGNVATQQHLPQQSQEGNQAGLDGVTVTVCDSVLTANDIASGGNGHAEIHRIFYNIDGGIYDIYGSAGGAGGTLIADHADITCKTALCGGIAGSYQRYETNSSTGVKTGDYECVYHPLDGNGGVIYSDNSNLTITDAACKKGNRWDDYKNPSTYSECVFLGGSLNGTVYGSIITTDMTSILGGGFIASTKICNSLDENCVECVLKTDNDMAGQTIQICANNLTETALLDDSGNMLTYLPVGYQQLKLSGAAVYTGTYLVKRVASLNDFQLGTYGKINVAHGGAVITKNTYTYQNTTYPYSGTYTVTGHSENAALTAESGTHQLVLRDTAFDTLNVNGTSAVILQPDGSVKINMVNVESGAVLTVASLGGIYVDTDGLCIGECHGVLQNEARERMHPVTVLFDAPGTYDVKLNEEKLTVTADENGLAHFLLAEGNYEFIIDREPFYFQGNLSVTDTVQLAQTDLKLCADISKGDLIIADHTITLGEAQIQSDADVYVVKSSDDVHEVYVEKKDAVITFENLPEDIQIHLPEDFEGQLIHASDLFDDKKDDPDNTQDTDTDTDTGADTDHNVSTDTGNGNGNGNGTDTDSGKNPDAGTVTTPGGGSSQTSHPSAGGSSHTSASSTPSASSASARASKPTAKDPTTATPAAVSPVRDSPSITLKSSLKGISILSANAKNTYKLFTRKKIRFTVAREADTDYYYKILERGQQNSEGQWKKMSSDKITVSDNAGSTKGRRIVFKAVNETGSTIQKTTGFVIDTKRPTINGVKNGRFYRKKCSIHISDNCGSCDVRLNGKKVKQNFSIQKSGIYLLTASDPAGNQRRVLFAVLY